MAAITIMPLIQEIGIVRDKMGAVKIDEENVLPNMLKKFIIEWVEEKTGF